MLAGLGALAVGVAIGWHLRLSQRRTRAAGAMPTSSSAKGAIAAPAASRFNKPVAGSGPSCACPS